jgi:hypothetical protein
MNVKKRQEKTEVVYSPYVIYEPGEKLQKRVLGEWMVLTILLPGSLSGRCQATGARGNLGV